MLASIITSVFNCKDYIGEMIDSVIAQTYKDWELIIIDDCSTDGTWDIISKYKDDRIIAHRNVSNCGLTRNLNKAWDIARGEFLFRIDGDDVLYEGRLRKQIDYMEEHSDVAILGSGIQLIGDEKFFCEYNCSSQMNRALILFDAVIAHSSMCINKRLLESKGIRYDNELRYAQDYDLEYRAFSVGEVTSIPQCTIKYRVHDRQISIDRQADQIECANVTRRKILNDMGIFLKIEDFGLWCNFCQGKYEACEDNIERLISICEIIKERNHKSRLCDESILNSVMDRRIKQLENFSRNTRMVETSFDLTKYRQMYLIQSIWNNNLLCGRTMDIYLENKKIKTIGIYGMGAFGKNLFHEIKEHGRIEILFLMDRELVGAYEEVKIYNFYEELPKVDAIIITVLAGFLEIKKQLNSESTATIISIQDLIHESSLL